MGPHQRVAPGPVEVDRHGLARRGQLAIRGCLELVHDLAADAPRGPDGPAAPVRGPQDAPAVRGLAATARVERRRVEHDEGGSVRRRDLEDARRQPAQVGVVVAALVDARHRAIADGEIRSRR